MHTPTIENKAAATILENPIATIEIGGKQYEVAPPTTATLIMVSSLISELPEINPDMPDTEILPAILSAAKDCEALGQIAATIILGAKKIKQYPMTTVDTYHVERKWSWRHFRKVEKVISTPIGVFERDYIADIILEEMTPASLHEFLIATLSEAHLADFFVLTTSLRTKSLLERTEVDETTASGLSLEDGSSIGN